MPRHYLKISKRLRPYAAKVARLDDDWRRMIFDDLTRGGRELRIIPVPPNDQGLLIGLCGETFYCHAGQDKHNAHSLFISRITSADLRPGRDAPTRILGEFELIAETDRNVASRDPVEPLFAQARAALEVEAPPRVSQPSEALLRVLAAADAGLRQRWSAVADASLSPPELLAALRRLWERFGLERFSEPEPRALALLKGTIVSPHQLTSVDLGQIGAAFGVETLNAMLSDSLQGRGQQQVFELLDELAAVPLGEVARAEIRAALAMATSPAAAGGERSAIVSRWIMRECGVLPADIARHAEAVSAAVAAWQAPETSVASAGDVLDFLGRLEALYLAVRASVEALPERALAERRTKEAERAYVRAVGMIGDETVRLIEAEPGLSAEALVDIAEIASQPGRLTALPAWLLVVSDARASQEGVARWSELAASGVRERVKRALALIDALDPDVRALVPYCPAPPVGADPDEHIRDSVAALERVVREIGDAVHTHAPWIRPALVAGLEPARVIELAAAIESMRPRLSADLLAGMVDDLGRCVAAAGHEGSAAGAARVDAYARAVEQIEHVFGSARDAAWSQLARLLERSGAPEPAPAERAPGERAPSASPAQPRAALGGALVRFDHNWVDETGRRVPLVFVPHDDRDRPYGVVRVPLVVRTAAPLDVVLDLDIEVVSSLRESWPDAWDRASPACLRIARSDWRGHGDEAQYTFELEVPLRRPRDARSGKESVDIALRALNRDTGLPASEVKRLRWSQISVWSGEIPFAWPDTVRPEYVREHPIGPQERHADIAERLVSGGSFAVIAPRRFGKTTLVEYLYEQASALSLAIAPPVVCTSVVGERGSVDYAALWERVSAGLSRILGAGMKPGQSGPLPDEDAFAAVRAAAHAQGFSAVVVLFDEAQLLFPRTGGDHLGDLFKDRIERCWSRADTPGQVPLVFGFIGLPGLRERAGVNLMGILRPYEGRQIEERALNRLILQVSRGRLSTTREARLGLAAQSGNLYILKTLLDRLVRHVNRKRRTWAALQDVLAVEAELRSELEHGVEHNLTQYMRDPLNESEDINQWEPRACYPVAVAMAMHSGIEGVEARMDAVLATLHDWARALDDGSGLALLFTRTRVEEHLATLVDLGLWNGGGFLSAIVRSWLVGAARSFPRSERDRQALRRAALERVRTPAELEPVGCPPNGLYRYSANGVSYALRKVPLSSDGAERRFVARARSLELIRQRQRLREAGAEYIYNLTAVGLAENEDVGVEIYPWIDGVSLEDKLGQLDAVLVADLGSKLAMALRLLHAHDVVHGDISPRSVILEQASMRPILIDLGGPHAVSAAGVQEGGVYQAPEVVAGVAPWTKAADVYAIGVTLGRVWSQASARPEEAEALDELIAACTRERPEERLDAESLVRHTDTVNATLKVYQRQEQAWRAVQEAARADLDKRWFRELMDKFRPKFVAILSGLHTDLFERSCEVALFLDQVLEAHPASAAELNLGRVKHRNDDTDARLVAPSIDLLHHLRLTVAHYRQSQPRSKLEQRFGIDDDDTLRELVVDGARRIGDFAALPSLPRVAEIVLSGEHSAQSAAGR